MAAAADAPDAAKRNRSKHIFAGVATLIVIVLLIATRSSPSPPAGATTAVPGAKGPAGAAAANSAEGADDQEPLPPREPGVIRALTPPAAQSDPEAAKDWNKVVEKLYKNDFGDARRKLAEWETKHGEARESRDLAEQLDQHLESAPAGPGPGPRGPGPRGRGKKHKGGDDD
jgi:hypothetical protein